MTPPTPPDDGMADETDAAAALRVDRATLGRAAARSGLAPDTVDALWRHLRAEAPAVAPAAPAGPRFDITHVLYYLGGMLAIGAATLFMTEGWELLGPWGLLAVCAVYGTVCVVLARRLDGRGYAVPAGILATLAVCLVPLATWALQQGLGLWPEGGPDRYAQYHTRIDWRWLTLELATLAAAAVALWALRHPFLVMPVAFTLWYVSMDLARLIVPPQTAESWTFYRDFSLFFGLGMTGLALWVDARSRGPGGSRRDYAFWLYLLGVLTFWGALTARNSDGELAKLAYAGMNLGLLAVGVLLQRRIFAVCGGLGIAIYLGYLSSRVFRDSLMFPLALTVFGLGVIGVGLWWQRHEARLHAAAWDRLPTPLRRWLPPPGG